VVGLFVAAELGHRKLEEVRRTGREVVRSVSSAGRILQLRSQAESSHAAP